MIVACSRLPLRRTIINSPWQVQRSRNIKRAFLRLSPIHTFILSLCCLLRLVITPVAAALVNVTVDDQLPDPLTGREIQYLPTTSWALGQQCTTCTANADESMMFDGTWHDGTYFPANSNLPPSGVLNITFTFNGTAIYVFCALALTLSSPTGFSNMSFYIDNELVGQFERVPSGKQGYQYNVSVYANDSLSAGEHTFMLQNGESGNLGNKSLTLFDYLVYSYDNGLPAEASLSPTEPEIASTAAANPLSDSRAPTTSLSTGAIAGITIGGIVSLTFIALLVWLLFIKKSRNAHMRVVDKHNPSPLAFTAQRMTIAPPPHPTILSIPAVQYGVGISKGRITQQQYIPSNSTVPSSSVNPPTTPGAQPSPVVRHEEDAGPVVFDTADEEEVRTLPPEYRFSLGTIPQQSVPISSPSPQPMRPDMQQEKLLREEGTVVHRST